MNEIKKFKQVAVRFLNKEFGAEEFQGRIRTVILYTKEQQQVWQWADDRLESIIYSEPEDEHYLLGSEVAQQIISYCDKWLADIEPISFAKGSKFKGTNLIDEIDGANVIAISPKGYYGEVCDTDGTNCIKVTYLAIAQYNNSDVFYLFLCDANMETVQDWDYSSLDAAFDSAAGRTSQEIEWVWP